MVWVLKPDFVSYFAYSLVRACQQILDAVDDGKVNVLNGRFARLLLHKVTKVIGGEVKLVGTPGNGRQPKFFRFSRVEVTAQQGFEAGEDIRINGFAGSELAVLETEAMVEQNLYIGHDDAPAVLVDGMPELFFYLIETVEDGLPFALRHVQSLVHFIRKEGIILHLPCQRRTPDEVGMKQQGIALRVQRLAAIVDAAHLTGGNEHLCAFLIVVLAASISDRPVNLLLQEDGIEAKAFAAVREHLHFREIDEAHQRVQCLQTEKLVVVMYRLQIQYFTHTCSHFNLIAQKYGNLLKGITSRQVFQ